MDADVYVPPVLFPYVLVIQMFKASVTALVLLAGTAPALAGPHEDCLKAADYEGCMRVQQNGGVANSAGDSLTDLRNAMKQVSARLTAGTSLRDSSEVFRPVTDALAVVPPSDQNSKAYQDGTKAANLFGLWQSAWATRIEASIYSRYGPQTYVCSALKRTADAFDRAAGTSMNWSYTKGLFGSDACQVRAGQLPEQYMRPVVISLLNEAAIDPKVLAAQAKEAARQAELAELSAWERHLEETPGLKEWAAANPKLADAKRKEWAAKNPTNVSNKYGFSLVP